MTTPAVSNLPPAARKQVNAANKLIAELNARPGAGAAPAAPAAPAGEPELPTVTVVPAAATAAAAAPAAPAEPENFETKYKVLQGKYNSETAELRGRLDASEKTTRTLIEASQRAPVAPAAPAAPMKPEDQFRALGVTEQEIKDYGPELMDIVARVARNLTAGDLQTLKAEVASLKQGMSNVGTTLQKNSQEAVFDALHAAFGDKWVTANKSDEFLAWLQEPDVFSGLKRLDGLQSAFQKADSARVVAIFKAYLGNTSPGPTPRQPAVARETLVAPAPGRGAAGETPGSSDGKVWSEQEITDFYQRARKGKVPEDEYHATEKAIHLAIAEGRVQAAKPQHHLNRI